MALRVPNSVLSQLDLRAALELEVSGGNGSRPLVPPSVIDPLVLADLPTFAQHIEDRIRGGLHDRTVEVLKAKKSFGSTRPVPILSISERCLFRSIEQAFRSLAPTEVATPLEYDAMQTGPIEAKCAWVVTADVTACFQYIDHDVLRDELVGNVGRADLADSLTDLLGHLLGRRFGVPQGSSSSDLFVDFYLDIAVRSLLRAGHAVWRHVDDFRLGASSVGNVHRAIEGLEGALAPLGLVLNGEKCYAFDMPAYSAWVAHPSKILDAFARDAYEKQ